MGDVPMCPMGHEKVSTVLMCPMVGRLEWDMGDGLDSPHVSHGRRNMLEWDMGDGLDSPHVSHGRRNMLEWDMGDGLDSPLVSHGRKNMLEWDMGDGLDSPMCPMVYVGVGHGGWFGQSPCVPW